MKKHIFQSLAIYIKYFDNVKSFNFNNLFQYVADLIRMEFSRVDVTRILHVSALKFESVFFQIRCGA